MLACGQEKLLKLLFLKGIAEIGILMSTINSAFTIVIQACRVTYPLKSFKLWRFTLKLLKKKLYILHRFQSTDKSQVFMDRMNNSFSLEMPTLFLRIQMELVKMLFS
jgi:hypothetical protein